MIALALALACTPEATLPSVPPTQPAADAAPQIWINEVMTDNASTVMDPALAFSDWFEVYNPGPDPIAVDRLSARDSAGAQWDGAGGEEIAPGGHLLVWADGDPFALSRDGDALALLLDGEPVDRIATGALGADLSWGRFPDGGAWAVTARPTPGSTNGASPDAHPDAAGALFDGAGVLPVEIQLTEAARRDLDEAPERTVQAGVGAAGAWLSPVGVRLKGGVGSFRDLDQKAAFRVDLNRYADLEFRGLEALTLNNLVQDPTALREHLAYRLFRAADLPAPRTRWVWLAVDGQDLGLYLLVEPVDDVFLARWYADPGGALYEGSYQADLRPGDELAFEYDEGPDPGDRADLTALSQALADGDMDAVEALVDMDRFRRYMAAEAVTMHWDGYTTANNFRLYHDPASGLFEFIPWGADQTFVTGDYYPYSGYGLLFAFCLSDAGCAAAYDDALLEMVGLAEDLALADEVDALWAGIAAPIAAQPRGEWSDAERSEALEVLRASLAEWPGELRGRVE